jgi:hypothetical protein
LERTSRFWWIVVPGDADTAAANRNGIHSYVATMMASLSECDFGAKAKRR